MKKGISYFLILLFCCWTTLASAGLFAVGCLLVCFSACESSCILASGGAAAAVCLKPCIDGCGIACIAACFPSSAMIVVIENGVAIEKPIADIQVGDIVMTMKDGELMETKVLKNEKVAGFHEFLQIDMQNIATQKYARLTVTPNHVVILRNEDGVLRVDSAKNSMVGDNMIASNGDILSVVDLQKTYMQDKYTLETSDGTVHASGVFVSTICSDMAKDGEYLFQPKMKEWNAAHETMIKKSEELK